MADQNRSGFTLVELLVVIVIIAMLMGLLVPAVLNARAAARRTECSNKQHQLALAFGTYETAKEHLPGFLNSFGRINWRQAPGAPLNWAVVLLPYMEREDLWEEWRPGGSRPVVELPLLICPSDRSEQEGLSYVVNCGVMDPPIDLSSPPSSLPPRGSPPDRAAFGLFLDRFYYGSPAVQSDRIRDGAPQTILFSENIQAWNWPDFVPSPQFTEARIGMVWSGDAAAPGACGNLNLLPVSVNDCLNATPLGSQNDIIYARPSSNHPDGVVVTFADGHQDFLLDEDSTDYNIFRQQLIPDDAAARKALLIP